MFYITLSRSSDCSLKGLYPPLLEKCPNTEILLVCIFPRSDWIRRDIPYLSVLSPITRKYGPEKTPYLDTFHTVHLTPGVWFYLWKPRRRFTLFIFNQRMNCCKPESMFQMPVDHKPMNKKITFISKTRNYFLTSISVTTFVPAFSWYIFVALATL